MDVHPLIETPCTHRGPATAVVVASLAPGDVLCLPPGPHPPIAVDDLHGRPEAPIVVRGAPDGGTVVRGATETWGEALRVTNSTWVTVTGVHLTHVQTGALVESSAWVRLIGLRVDAVGQAGVAVRRQITDGAFAGPASHHVDVIGNDIRDTGRQTARYGEGIYVGTGGVDGDDTHHVVLAHNHIADTRAEGIEVKPYTHHVEVRENTVSGGRHFFHGAITVAVQGRRFGDGRYLVVGNRVHGFRGIDGLVGGIVVGHGTTWVLHNAVWDVDGAGLRTTTTFAEPAHRTVRMDGNRVWCAGRCVGIAVHLGDERTGRHDGLGEVVLGTNHTDDGSAGSARLPPDARPPP